MKVKLMRTVGLLPRARRVAGLPDEELLSTGRSLLGPSPHPQTETEL